MFKYSVHIGHSLLNTGLLASWLLLGFRQNIWFINILKTIFFIKVGFKIIHFTISNYQPFWLINLDITTELLIQSIAVKVGEFFVVSHWRRGLLSNYKQVIKTYSHLRSVYISMLNEKSKKFYEKSKFFLLSRFSWPRAIFVFSCSRNEFPIKEAFSLEIPCLAIIDTDAKSQGVTIPIPGNDDSTEALVYYGEIISSNILINKFNTVLFWFSSTRSALRNLTFMDWFKLKYEGIDTEKKPPHSFFMANKNEQFLGFILISYFCKNSLSFKSFKTFNFWSEHKLNVNEEKVTFSSQKKKSKSLLNINYISNLLNFSKRPETKNPFVFKKYGDKKSIFDKFSFFASIQKPNFITAGLFLNKYRKKFHFMPKFNDELIKFVFMKKKRILNKEHYMHQWYIYPKWNKNISFSNSWNKNIFISRKSRKTELKWWDIFSEGNENLHKLFIDFGVHCLKFNFGVSLKFNNMHKGKFKQIKKVNFKSILYNNDSKIESMKVKIRTLLVCDIQKKFNSNMWKLNFLKSKLMFNLAQIKHLLVLYHTHTSNEEKPLNNNEDSLFTVLNLPKYFNIVNGSDATSTYEKNTKLFYST